MDQNTVNNGNNVINVPIDEHTNLVCFPDQNKKDSFNCTLATIDDSGGLQVSGLSFDLGLNTTDGTFIFGVKK